MGGLSGGNSNRLTQQAKRFRRDVSTDMVYLLREKGRAISHK